MKMKSIPLSLPLLLIFFHPAVHSSPLREAKSSLALDQYSYNSFQPQGIGSYSFGYEVEDPEYRNIQYRNEERSADGTVTGSYGWVKPDGNVIMVKYIADEDGYRASVANSEGQLKFFGKPIPRDFLEANGYFPIRNAVEKLPLLGQQSVLEKHYRPIDLFYPNAPLK